MITLRWAQSPGSDVVQFKLYRSIIGFSAPLAPALAGKTLSLKINGGALQTFTFDAGDPVELINEAILYGQAYLSADGLRFFVRSNIRQAPGSVEIAGGTALGDLALTARLITEKSEDELIATVEAAEDVATALCYEDLDGSLSDFYAISAIDSFSVESLKSAYKAAIDFAGPVCTIQGIVVDLRGARVPDAEVKAIIQVPPQYSKQSVVTKDVITVLSGPDGKFNLPLLQKSLVRLEIPAIGYGQMITVPELVSVLLNDLEAETEYRYPLGYHV
jgi:hypothetical protein